MRNIISKILFTLLVLTMGIGQMWGAYTYNASTSVPEWTVNFNSWAGESDASGATDGTVHNPRLYWNGSAYKNNLGEAKDIAFDAGGFYYIYAPNEARQLPTGSALSALCYVVAKAQGSYFKYNSTSSTVSDPVTTLNGLTTNNSQTTDVSYEFHMPRAGYVRMLIGTDANGDPTGTTNDSWKNVTLSGATEGTVAVTYHASGSTYVVKTKTGATTFSTTTYTSAGKKMRSVEFALNSGTTTMTTNPAKLSNNSGTARKMFIYAVEVYLEAETSCAATAPGNLKKSLPSAGVITLTAEGSAASGDTWYWQTAANGTSTSDEYSSGKEVSSTCTWYLRSYNTAGDCWSSAKSVEVTAEDFVVKYAITKGTHANGDFTISPATQEAGEEVTLSATPDEGYLFDAWSIIKTEDESATGITVTNDKFTMPAYAVTVNATFVADPCHKYFWFSKAADATTAGVTNNEGSFFTTSASGSNGVTSSITIDGTEYAITNRTSNIGSSDATIVSFTVPSNKAGIFYTNMSSSGNKGAESSRTLYLKKSGVTVVTATDAIYGDGAQHNATIENIPTGTYTLHANNNVKVGMLALKVCDATYHTITLDLDYGTGETSIQALDGVPAYKPADPTKANNTFSKWVVKSTGVDYNWSSNVTGDLELKAIWTPYPTLTLNAGEGSGDNQSTPYAPNTEITVPAKPDGFTYTGHSFTGWKDGSANDYAVGDPLTITADLTLIAQWALDGSFDVRFFPGYGANEQIGTTQSITTGNYATPEANPTRAGYRFLGWSTDGTEANIVTVASYAISVATDFTAVWIQQFEVTFDGAGAVNVDNGAAVAAPDAPTQAGKVFQGWYNGESKYDFSAAVTGNLALESKWADADPNHYTYAYNDDTRFDGVVYHTPEGKVDNGNGTSNKAMTTPYTLFSGEGGITSIVMTDGIYDSKTGAIQAVTSHMKVNNTATSKLTITIKAGYTATLKIKAAGYSASRTMSVSDATPASLATPTNGKIVTNSAMSLGTLEQQTFALTAGSHDLTVTGGTLYISEMDIEAEALPTYTVTYKAGEGTGDDVIDADATNVADVPGSFTAPEGKIFNGWKDGEANDVAVGTIVTASMTLTAQWINHYAVTFNMKGHGDAIDPQDIKHGAKAEKPADPTETDYDFGGWFTDTDCTVGNEFDFNTAITAATELFAKWTVDPCLSSERKSLSKVVLSKPSDYVATVTGYNNEEYAGSAVIGGLGEAQAADVDPSHEGNETGYKLASGGNAIVFATLSKGTFQEGDKVVVTITKAQDAYKVEEVPQPILDIYYGTNKDDATFLTTISGVSATGSYTYRLTAADITTIGSKTGIGVFRPSSGRTQNPYVYSVEIQGCRSWAISHTLTFKNADGSATIASPSLEEGVAASTVAPTAPKVDGYRFIGWGESVGGSTVNMATYTITDDATLYAVYEEIICPTSGTLYKFVVKDGLTAENLPTVTDKDMSSYVDETGDGALTYTATANNKATINNDGTITLKDATDAYLKVELECAMAAGDQIRSTISGNPMRVQVGTTYDADKDLILTKDVYNTVDITSAMEGKKVLYIARSTNGNANLADFEVYRRPVLTGVTMNDAIVRVGSTGTPTLTLLPANDALVTNQVWTIEGEGEGTIADINATTGEVTGLAAGDVTVKVVLNSNPSIYATATVHVVNDYTRQDVTGSISWSWDKNGALSGVDAQENVNVSETLLANIGTMPNNAAFQSDKLVTTCQHAYRSGTGNGCWQGTEIKFYTTVPGAVTVNYMGTGNSDAVTLSINNWTADEYAGGWTDSKTIVVPSGWVTISASVANKLRIKSITFDAALDPTKTQEAKYQYGGYERATTEGRYGTICLPNGGVMVGADLFEVAYYGATSQKIFFDQIMNGEMEAGIPYIFLPKEGVSQLGVYYTDAAGSTAGNRNGLYGSYTTEVLTRNDGNYVLYNNQYLYVASTSTNVKVGANRAYIKIGVEGGVPTSATAPAPGRRRVSMDVVGAPQVTTGVDELNADETPVKVMIDGQLYIIRGEKMYDATGRLVK